MTILHVTKAQYLRGYKIHVEFNDGSGGEIDLAGKLTGSMFEPLVDKTAFANFRVDEELGTILWENGADLAPEYLKQLLDPVAGATTNRRPISRNPAQRRATKTARTLRTARELPF